MILLAFFLVAAPLRVFTKPIEPFSFKKDGADAGFSIELWERVAKETGLQYEITWVKTVSDLIEALKDGKADVAIAAISITAEREKVVDFSQPYYESGLQILVSPTPQSSASTLMATLFTWDFAKVIGMLALALLLSSHLLWFFERRHNEENFPRPYRHGVWESLWWTSSVLITGGCENKTPTGVGGRLVGVVWMLTGILLVSYITATVTSAMTVKSLTAGINGPSDLPGQIVGAPAGTTAERYLADHKIETRSYPTVDEAYVALAKGEVKAVVYDAPVLQYHAARGGQDKVVGHRFERANYGIALQEGSKLRKQINETLLRLTESGFIAELRQKYFGDSD